MSVNHNDVEAQRARFDAHIRRTWTIADWAYHLAIETDDIWIKAHLAHESKKPPLRKRKRLILMMERRVSEIEGSIAAEIAGRHGD